MPRVKTEDYTRFPLGPPIAGTACDPHSLGYVYIIGFEEPGIVKIGSATSMVSRLLQLQCGNPFQLRLKAAVSIYSGSPGEVERAAHTLAQPVHIRGEWFELDDEEALACVLKAARDKRVRHGPMLRAYEAELPGSIDRQAEEDARRAIIRRKLGMEA